jgi:hypothetical protein
MPSTTLSMRDTYNPESEINCQTAGSYVAGCRTVLTHMGERSSDWAPHSVGMAFH